MKRFLYLTFIFITSSLYGSDYSDYYGSMAEIISQPDPDTGLTVFPTLLIPMGGKLEGMGTAYTAVSKDFGFIESNPSASSVLKYTELTFSHNNWIADSRMEGVVYTVRFNDLGIGAAGKFLYVPFTEYDTWGERVSKGYYSETIATMNISYNFFPTYYFYGVAVGANLKFAYRNIPASIYPDQSAIAFMTDIGALTRFNFAKPFVSRSKNFSVGAVIKNLGPYVLQEPLPTEVTVGIAYSPIRPVTAAVDLNLPVTFNTNYPAENWNIVAGTDIVFTDFFSVQGGFRYRGSNPGISLGATVDLQKMSFIVNYTMDLTTQFGVLDRFSLAARLKIGDRGRAALQARVDELYITALEEYANGNLEEAITYLEKALEIDPRFIPAAELLRVLQQTISLHREMEDIQKIEE
ncbi:MAG: hypothetical protein DRP87_00950 [Spirochaetes bacterium]|nr:MAG: hypothetical protein DRP87_00950 [Spirochaetota bacterium]